MGATNAASRVRLMLEGTGTIQLSNEAVLSPTLEIGLRKNSEAVFAGTSDRAAVTLQG